MGICCYDAGSSNLMLWDNLERWDWVEDGKDKIYVYLWLIHVAVWQKPTQYYKAVILQLNINNFFKKKNKANHRQVFRNWKRKTTLYSPEKNKKQLLEI